MKIWLLIFIGSGLGGVTRYAVGKVVTTYWESAFPLPTLVINVCACFILGIVAGFVKQKIAYHQELQYFLMIGFCGGFSTFSTFSMEMLKLLEAGQYIYVWSYTALSICLCLASVFLGMKLVS